MEQSRIKTSGDYRYGVLDDGTAEITKYRGKAGELKIPSELEGYKVTEIGDRAFAGCKKLTAVTIPEGVTSIGRLAFASCSSLTSITLPASLTRIGDLAFAGCESLASITIPGGVRRMGANPFALCEKLDQIAVSPDNKNLEEINGVLFFKPDSRLVRYPSGQTSREYSIPEEISAISDQAFAGCENLTAVTLPGSVTRIGNGAFFACKSLTAIKIPASVTRIGYDAFYSCSDQLVFIVEEGSYAEEFCMANGFKYRYTDEPEWMKD